MKYPDTLSDALIARCQQGVTQFVAICGAADLGKTTMCNDLVDRLYTEQITADRLSMDSYLIPRYERGALGISGYDLGAYEWQRLLYDISMLQQGTLVLIQEYDHQAGRTSGPWQQIKPVSYIFIDGLHAMDKRLMCYVDFSVFIYTSDEQLKTIRHHADLTKRQQSEAFSLRQAENEFLKYKVNIEPYRKEADMAI